MLRTSVIHRMQSDMRENKQEGTMKYEQKKIRNFSMLAVWIIITVMCGIPTAQGVIRYAPEFAQVE